MIRILFYLVLSYFHVHVSGFLKILAGKLFVLSMKKEDSLTIASVLNPKHVIYYESLCKRFMLVSNSPQSEIYPTLFFYQTLVFFSFSNYQNSCFLFFPKLPKFPPQTLKSLSYYIIIHRDAQSACHSAVNREGCRWGF